MRISRIELDGVNSNGKVQADPLATLSEVAGITLQVGKRKFVKLV